MKTGALGQTIGEVAHFDVLENMYTALEYIAREEYGFRKAQFWHVPREMNRDADTLANKAFDAV